MPAISHLNMQLGKTFVKKERTKRDPDVLSLPVDFKENSSLCVCTCVRAGKQKEPQYEFGEFGTVPDANVLVFLTVHPVRASYARSYVCPLYALTV